MHQKISAAISPSREIESHKKASTWLDSIALAKRRLSRSSGEEAETNCLENKTEDARDQLEPPILGRVDSILVAKRRMSRGSPQSENSPLMNTSSALHMRTRWLSP